MKENKKEEDSIQILVKAHQKLKSLQQDNEILRMHVNLLEKDNQKLAELFSQVQSQKTLLLCENEKLVKRLKDIGKEKTKEKDFLTQDKIIQESHDTIEANKSKTEKKIEGKLNSDIYNNTLKKEKNVIIDDPTQLKTTLETSQCEEFYDSKQLISFQEICQRRSTEKSQRNQSIRYREGSPMIRKNSSHSKDKLKCSTKSSKKFNYTHWRKENNDMLVWRQNKPITL